MESLYQNKLNEREHTGKKRTLPGLDGGEGRGVREGVSPYLDFSTNDYLGFSRNPGLLEAAYAAGKRYGVGSTGSRLLSGNTPLFELFEARIAQDKHTEAALIFNSGYQANLTVLASLCDASVLGHRPLLFFDRLNHASLYQAASLSKAQLVRYHHQDLGHLRQLLTEFQEDPRTKFIVTETLFGMDGDVVDLDALVSLAKPFNTFLYLDEAHGTGLLGPLGYGLSTTLSLASVPHVIMGTFSKALGSFGAYIACSRTVKDYLINLCPGFIYTTALPPPVIGATAQAWEGLPQHLEIRDQLFRRAAALRLFLNAKGFDTGRSTTPIIPVILGDERKTVLAQQMLLEKGIHVSAIRPPTVPPGTSRLRIALTAHHRDADIQHLQEAFEGL
jgi:8-amino-7-oxononanoate synthase